MANISNGGILQIFQWNSYGSLNEKHKLQNFRQNYDLIIIVKSFLKTNKNFILKDFAIIRNDRLTNKKGFICICIKKDIIFKRLDSFIDIPDKFKTLNVLSFPDAQNPILISAVYRPPHDDFSNNLWNRLFQKIDDFIRLTN